MASEPQPTEEQPARRGAPLDLSEKGRTRQGEILSSSRRLYLQFLAYGGCREPSVAVRALEGAGVPAVLYEDLNDPFGIAVLFFHEEPDFFLDEARALLLREPFASLVQKHDYTMFGRTYSMGWEPDLDEALVNRPTARLLDPALRWVVWYPLRRAGSFEELAPDEQRSVLSEHGAVGQSFGRAGFAHDIRLACQGLSRDDNDFVIGLLGTELQPLSAVVQRMRKTRQTSQFLTRLGPFFVGRKAWQRRE